MKKITDQIERLDELEKIVDELIELNREVVAENQLLREKQKKLLSENSALERKTEEARSKVSAVIARLNKH